MDDCAIANAQRLALDRWLICCGDDIDLLTSSTMAIRTDHHLHPASPRNMGGDVARFGHQLDVTGSPNLIDAIIPIGFCLPPIGI